MHLQKSIGNQAVQRILRSGDLDFVDTQRTASINVSPSELRSTPALEIATIPAEAETMPEEAVTPLISTPPTTRRPTSTVTDTQARVAEKDAKAAADGSTSYYYSTQHERTRSGRSTCS